MEIKEYTLKEFEEFMQNKEKNKTQQKDFKIKLKIDEVVSESIQWGENDSDEPDEIEVIVKINKKEVKIILLDSFVEEGEDYIVFEANKLQTKSRNKATKNKKSEATPSKRLTGKPKITIKN